jgi:large subunit ribosomal protein L29
MNKELRAKTNEELCTLIMRLKLQLLESRFRMASGELDKTNALVDVRKTIARALTILHQRNIKLTIGTHGVTMYDTKNNTVKSINNLVEESLKASQETKAKNAKGITAQEVIQKATVAGPKVENKTDGSETKATPMVKKELKSKMEKQVVEKTTHIRKTSGGS